MFVYLWVLPALLVLPPKICSSACHVLWFKSIKLMDFSFSRNKIAALVALWAASACRLYTLFWHTKILTILVDDPCLWKGRPMQLDRVELESLSASRWKPEKNTSLLLSSDHHQVKHHHHVHQHDVLQPRRWWRRRGEARPWQVVEAGLDALQQELLI